MFRAKLKEQSNQSDWSFVVYMVDKTSGDYIDLSHVTDVSVSLQLLGHINCPALQGSLATGEITLPAPGTIWAYFPAARMQGLTSGSYQIGMTLKDDANRTMQVLVGILPVIAGQPGVQLRPNVWSYS